MKPTALTELIEYIQQKLPNYDEDSNSDSNYKLGLKDAMQKAISLLPKERWQIKNGWDEARKEIEPTPFANANHYFANIFTQYKTETNE